MKLNKNRRINNGMWAVGILDGNEIVGIVHNIDFKDDRCNFHIVKDNGETKKIIYNVCLSKLRQAKYEEIPLKRRGERNIARSYGY